MTMVSGEPTDLGFLRYAPPDCDGLVLDKNPLLESWDKKGHPSQVALQAYLAALTPLVQSAIDAQPHSLALELVVGLPPRVLLTTGGRDLDNYLLPVVRALGPSRFLSVWGTKGRDNSTVRVGPARVLPPEDLSGWSFASAVTHSSVEKVAWKEAVRAQIAGQVSDAPGSGAIDMQICFRISGRRNWSTLWKPAIDALGPVLGEGSRPFHPKDDRIVRLGLHRVVDSSVGWSVDLGVWWRAACG